MKEQKENNHDKKTKNPSIRYLCRNSNYSIPDTCCPWENRFLVDCMKNINDFLKNIPCIEPTQYKGCLILKTENKKRISPCGRKKKYVYCIAGDKIQKKPFTEPILWTLQTAKEYINEQLQSMG